MPNSLFIAIDRFFSSAISLITEPLTFVFMRQAIAIGFFLGILSAVVGSYLILQQMGMMGGVISHAVLPGISIAFFLEINLAIGAFIAGILSALLVMGIETRSRIKVDSAMALTLSSFLALGIILINLWLKALVYKDCVSKMYHGVTFAATPT